MARAGTKVATCLVFSACGNAPPPAVSAARGVHAGGPRVAQEMVWDYQLVVREDLSIDVEGSFRGPVATGFSMDEDMAPFVRDVTIVDGASLRRISRNGAHVDALCVAGCRLRYSVALAEAGARLSDVDTALAAGGAVFFPVSSLLLTPGGTSATGRYRLTVHAPPGIRFETGLRPVKGAPGAYEADVSTEESSTFAALGALRVQPIGDGRVVAAVAADARISDADVKTWLGAELSALDGYLGHFPEDRVMVLVAPGTGPVMRGVTRGGGGASILLRLPANASSVDLASEWVALHELLHAGSPDLVGGHRWFSEGWASYVEPFARARAGLVPPERVWKDLMDGLPQGLPAPGDRGLEFDQSWGRTYWGGALYFFLADVSLREAFQGERSLETAARALAKTGGTVESAWPIERVVATLDAGSGGHVFRDLFGTLALAPGTADLEAIWRRLGIQRAGDSVSFDETAELAEIRKNMTSVSVPAPVGGKLP
ncbi:MAG TPA: hypothetical protein VHE30_27440 [Polyangiaceae bacterium]|nr:hypothetical protein [Polyangiaceae bacterium]